MLSPRLPWPCLMLVTDRTLTADVDGLVRAVAGAVAGGVNAVQIREKDLPADELYLLVQRLRREIGGEVPLLLNALPADARSARADGVHLTEEGISAHEARQLTDHTMLVGRSVHTLTRALDAARDGTDYLVLGTVFPSRSHPGGATGGLALVANVAAAVTVPVIGIGGITHRSAGAVIEAGAAGVAVISAILGAANVRTAAARLRNAINNGVARRIGHAEVEVR